MIITDYQLNSTDLVYYSLNDSLLSELGRVGGVGRDEGEVIAFAPQAENKIIISRWRSMYDYNVEIRDTRTFELLNYVELPGNFVPVAYEFESDRVIARYQYFPTIDYSYLIDMKTGIRQKIVPFTSRENIVFTEGIVFSGNGRSVEIDSVLLK